MMLCATALVAAVDAGGYISLIKLLPVLVLLFVWAKLLTWADKDTIAAHLPRELLNCVLFGAAILGFSLFFLLPGFWVALGALGFFFLASVGTYLGMRHKSVGLGDLKKEMKLAFGGGKKKSKETKAGDIAFSRKGGSAMAVPEAETPERLGYDTAQTLLVDPIRKNAERVEIRPVEGGVSVQFVVDGVAYAAPAVDKDACAAGITYLKKGAGMDVEDRRKPQTGNLRATLDGTRHELDVMTAGTTAGESMRITIDAKKRWEHKLETIGFQPDQLAAIQAWVAEPGGIILLSAPKQQGLTTLQYCILRAHDAYLRHIQTVERTPREDLEGITQNKLAGNTPQDEFKQVEWVCSQEPDVLLVDEVTNPASARELIKFASTGKRVYVGFRSGSTFDALNVWRKLVGDDDLATQYLGLIVSGRILRKLCNACKVGYAPDPDTLKKLNMDPARITQLYQARTTPLTDPKGRPIPCTFCQDLRYKGRFGIYEMLAVDDEVRQAVLAGGSANQLKTAFRKQRGRYLQELALAQVEAGDTSIQEVLRVLRGPEQAERPSRTAAAPEARRK